MTVLFILNTASVCSLLALLFDLPDATPTTLLIPSWQVQHTRARAVEIYRELAAKK